MYPFADDYNHYVLVEVAQTVDMYDESSESSDYPAEGENDRLYAFIESIEDEIRVSSKYYPTYLKSLQVKKHSLLTYASDARKTSI